MSMLMGVVAAAAAAEGNKDFNGIWIPGESVAGDTKIVALNNTLSIVKTNYTTTRTVTIDRQGLFKGSSIAALGSAKFMIIASTGSIKGLTATIRTSTMHQSGVLPFNLATGGFQNREVGSGVVTIGASKYDFRLIGTKLTLKIRMIVTGEGAGDFVGEPITLT